MYVCVLTKKYPFISVSINCVYICVPTLNEILLVKRTENEYTEEHRNTHASDSRI